MTATIMRKEFEKWKQRYRTRFNSAMTTGMSEGFLMHVFFDAYEAGHADGTKTTISKINKASQRYVNAKC